MAIDSTVRDDRRQTTTDYTDFTDQDFVCMAVFNR
ncbi:MAG: hypothetical protein JWO87_630 [Phycisphaerales bacterium]|nr:hypothetical protein [Phycisphaerales bacterium]